MSADGRRSLVAIWPFLFVLAAGLAVVGCDDEPASPGLGPGIWIAAARPVQSPFYPDAAPLRIFNIVTGEERSVGDRLSYVSVRWSPDGERLAAISVGDIPVALDIRLLIWDSGGRQLADIPFGTTAGAPQHVEWSPDGTRLAAAGTGGVWMFDRDGHRQGVVAATQGIGGSTSYGLGPGPRWSPDSGHYVYPANHLLMVVDRNGHGGEYDLPRNAAGIPASNAQVARWTSTGQIDVVINDEAIHAREYTGVLASGQIAWDAGRPVDFASVIFPDQARVAKFDILIPDHRYQTEARSADSSASVVRLFEAGSRSPVPAPGDLVLLLELDGQTSQVELGPADSEVRDSFDVVVRPGWDGPVPTLVHAVTPMPSPAPSRTPPPYQTPVPTPSGYPTAPVPYPSPRGEHVDTQVVNLPVYPGARELDGWSDSKTPPRSIQMYGTPDSQQSVVDFYAKALTGAGFSPSSGGESGAGVTREYFRGRDRVLISTQYIPRPEDELPDGVLPYGFQGKGDFSNQINGETFFFVVTLRAPDPP